MLESDKEKSMVLDGSDEEQKKAVEAWLDSFTEEENARAMSDELAYLDED